MVAAAIIAGGAGHRMSGAVKPLLVVEGRRIIDRQLEVLRPLFGALVIVANDPSPFRDLDVAVTPDRGPPGLGPLAGLDAALAYFPPPITDVVCLAGDMPFLEPALLRALRDAPAALAVVPRVVSRAEPLCARYARRFARQITGALSANQLALHRLVCHPDVAFIEEPALRALDPSLRSFRNINTPEDLAPSKAPGP